MTAYEDRVSALMKRSDAAMESAKVLLEKRLFPDSVSRSYCAIFYAASAALAERGTECKTHKGLITEFGRELVKNGPMWPEDARILDNAFALRQDADYHYFVDISRGFAERQLADAEAFIANVRKVIEP